jgi:hypothetical protein
MDNQYYSKALKKYNSNKIKMKTSIKSNNKLELSQPNNNLELLQSNNNLELLQPNNIQLKKNQEDNVDQVKLKTNEWLLNGKCRVCNLEDRTCRCLRFSKDYVERICYCGNKECEFDCGVLVCGCIDVCRKHRDYNDY